MSDDFDPTPYVRPPLCDVASGFALGVARADKEDLPPPGAETPVPEVG
ncbi:MAG: hypothetical protein HUU21_18140 [Polyangiaceae bacterium]|nr:hypothetical protein [Polyangiaceae bacterium]